MLGEVNFKLCLIKVKFEFNFDFVNYLVSLFYNIEGEYVENRVCKYVFYYGFKVV